MSQIIKAGIVIGLGLMGIFDAILFTQILQWHHFFTIGDIQRQIYQDGIFNLIIWVIVLIGAFMLFRAATQFNIRSSISGRVFIGALLIGGGLFNFLEGLINHQILGIHHLLPGPNQFTADMVFLASGIVLPLMGYFYIRKERAE